MAIIASLAMIALPLNAGSNPAGVPPHGGSPVTLRYFGLHRSVEDPWPAVPFGSWRITVAWRSTEPEKGVWDFKKPDQEVDAATQHDVDLVVNLGFTPTWASSTPDKKCVVGMGMCAEPKNMEDWRDWLRTIGTRYKGRVKYYEVWNEPNDRAAYYTGSVSGLVEMTKAAHEVLKSIDPNIQILSPAPTTPAAGLKLMEDFLAAGGGNYSDVISYHFYVHPGPPEGVFRYGQQLRSMMRKHGVDDKPLWDSEIGWAAPQFDDKTQAAYVARAMVLQRAAGVSRVFWYGWGFRREMKLQLVEADLRTPSAAGQALKIVEDWMIGAVVNSCESSDIPAPKESSHSAWICVLQRDATKSYVVWNPDGDKRFNIPPSWHVTRAHDLFGQSSTLPQDRQITIREQPVLLNSSQ